MSLNILLEYNSVSENQPASTYRAIIETDRSRLCRDIQGHLKRAGVPNPSVFVLSFNTDNVRGEETSTKFYLQRWNREWDCFINVDSLEDVQSGDKLTVAKLGKFATQPMKHPNTQNSSRKRPRYNDVRTV